MFAVWCRWHFFNQKMRLTCVHKLVPSIQRLLLKMATRRTSIETDQVASQIHPKHPYESRSAFWVWTSNRCLHFGNVPWTPSGLTQSLNLIYVVCITDPMFFLRLSHVHWHLQACYHVQLAKSHILLRNINWRSGTWLKIIERQDVRQTKIRSVQIHSRQPHQSTWVNRQKIHLSSTRLLKFPISFLGILNHSD